MYRLHARTVSVPRCWPGQYKLPRRALRDSQNDHHLNTAHEATLGYRLRRRRTSLRLLLHLKLQLGIQKDFCRAHPLRAGTLLDVSANKASECFAWQLISAVSIDRAPANLLHLQTNWKCTLQTSPRLPSIRVQQCFQGSAAKPHHADP